MAIEVVRKPEWRGKCAECGWLTRMTYSTPEETEGIVLAHKATWEHRELIAARASSSEDSPQETESPK